MRFEVNLKCIKIFGIIITTEKRLSNMHLDLYLNEEDRENIKKKLNKFKRVE